MTLIDHFHCKYEFAQLQSCQFEVNPKLINNTRKYKYKVLSHKVMIYRIISPIFSAYVVFIVDSFISLEAFNT